MKEEYDFDRFQKVKEDADRKKRTIRNKDIRQKEKFREPLDIGEPVYILPEQLKKKYVAGRPYKSSPEKKLFFNRQIIFTVRKRLQIDSRSIMGFPNQVKMM